MESAIFAAANTVLGPPDGLKEDEVSSLSVWRGLSGKHDVVISCWKPTAEEIAEICRTGRVWLYIWGKTMPPVLLTGLTPNFPKDATR